MDITLIWFPLMKFAVTVGLLYGVYYFIKTKRNKVATLYGAMLVVFWIFTPFRYDGTNSVERNVVTQEIRTQQYKEVRAEEKVVVTKKPSFEERIALEIARSIEANKVVTNDIVK